MAFDSIGRFRRKILGHDDDVVILVNEAGVFRDTLVCLFENQAMNLSHEPVLCFLFKDLPAPRSALKSINMTDMTCLNFTHAPSAKPMYHIIIRSMHYH